MLLGDRPSYVGSVQLSDLTLAPIELAGANASLPGDAVARCDLLVVVISISDRS